MSAARRRGSLASLDSTCLVANCQLPAVRRGGYCVYHTNQFNSSAMDPKSAPAEVVCLGGSCQGTIKGGYCERHRPLGGETSGLTMPASAELHDRRKKVSGGRKAPSLVEDQINIGNKGMHVLQKFLDGLHSIFSEVEPHRASEMIIKEACSILECERATLFYVDGDELVLMIAKGAKNIRLPKSKGIAGYVATSGHTVKIDDAYAEARFDPSFDKQTGFKTRNILATPVFDRDSEVIAVLQVINKQIEGKDSTFNANDVTLIEALAFHCGVSLRNAQMFEQLKRSEAKISSLLEIIQMLNMGPSLNSLIFTLSSRSPTLVECDRCTLYLTDRLREQLVVMTGDVDIRIPLAKGIAGYCATSGKIVNIPDCYKDERFNAEIDKQTGYRTRSMLCMPIPGEEQNEIIGVLQLINRLDEEPFQSADENILTTLLSIAGPILKKSSFFNLQKEKVKSTPNEVAPTMSTRPRGGSGSHSPTTRERRNTGGGSGNTPTMGLKRLPELPE